MPNSNFSSQRFDFYGDMIDNIIKDFPQELLDYIYTYLKETKAKFKMPQHPELHTVENWSEPINNEKIRNKILTKKDILEYFRVAVLSAIFSSDHFQGVHPRGYTEIHGPIIAKFTPEKHRVFCYFINPAFLWTADLKQRGKLPYWKLEVGVMNELICKDTVRPLVEYSVYNNDFDFGENESSEFVRVNNAIEHLVESSDLNNVGDLQIRNGLVGIVTPTQYLFTFSPVILNFEIKIHNMLQFHDREWLTKWKIS